MVGGATQNDKDGWRFQEEYSQVAEYAENDASSVPIIGEPPNPACVLFPQLRKYGVISARWSYDRMFLDNG